jgi:hypothetical protein
MPYGPFHRQTPEYQKKLERRELRQLFGSDAPDVAWVDQLILRLNATPPDLDYTDKDYDDMEKARHILHQLRIKAGFDPSQPRVPAGNSEGGEWTDTGGGGNGGGGQTGVSAGSPPVGGRGGGNGTSPKPLNVDTAVQFLHDNISPKKYGDRACARNVANAVRASGIKVTPPPVRIKEGASAPWAKDYGPSLEAAGFDRVTEIGYTPQKGDIVVIQSIPKHKEGHMAMYDGKQWVSDFKQENGIWPHRDYQKYGADYAIYRHRNRK